MNARTLAKLEEIRGRLESDLSEKKAFQRFSDFFDYSSAHGPALSLRTQVLSTRRAAISAFNRTKDDYSDKKKKGHKAFMLSSSALVTALDNYVDAVRDAHGTW